MQDVKTDRHKFIGGSDIPIIMGISHFKSRYDLLLEKAQLKEDDFDGNEYTEYGNIMEPKIRQYINVFMNRNFKEDKLEKNDIRCHFDGIDDDTILEIKTTSQLYQDVNAYKVYLVQLLFYMMNANINKGILAVYERPDDFNEIFDSDRLYLYTIDIDNYKKLCNEILEAVEQFKIDLEKVKNNPFTSEENLINNDVVSLAHQVIKLENQLQIFDKITKQRDELKAKLKEAMQNAGLKTWETPNGTKITLVEDKQDEEVEEIYYDEEAFIRENTELHQAYHNKLAEYKETRKKIKKGKKGYVLITLKKENEKE